jgi:hypothetical protein
MKPTVSLENKTAAGIRFLRFLIAAELASIFLSAPLIAGEEKAPAANRPIRFEIQGNASIGDCADDLAGALRMAPTQKEQLKVLMSQRSQSIEDRMAEAKQSFRQSVKELLGETHTQAIIWEKVERWRLSDWETAVSGVTPEQRSELDRLIKVRHDQVWKALHSAQQSFAADLQALLTGEQRKRLVAQEREDSVVRIPMKP